MITAKEVREKFLEFFKARGHTIIPSAPLVPENDPTVLFTTAGMHPLVPYLLGQEHPAGKRLASLQKCMRTDDIDQVGDAFHNTFFEMLGNWSLGDYWKKEAISWSYEFLTDKKWLGIAPKNLAISIFAGDEDAPRDEESAKIWKSLGIPEERIAYLPKEDNWWGPAGITGPCGPDTEMFCWPGKEAAPEKFDPKNPLWFEVWNDVFMEYNRTAQPTVEPLKQKNVDTGMGLERMTAVMEGKESVYETELFAPIIQKIQSLATKQDTKSERIIADHLRAATFIIADGVAPSNKERGYILRRLIRRAVRHGQILGVTEGFCTEVAAVAIKIYKGIYPELAKNQEKIIETLAREDLKFRKALEKGMNELARRFPGPIVENYIQGKEISTPFVLGRKIGREAFDLVQTYGLTRDIIRDYLQKGGMYEFDEEEFNKAFEAQFKKHQDMSRTSTVGVFKGGLADYSERTTRLHTATHLLQAGLRRVLGPDVFQKGSHITAERTRFDFTYPKKVSPEELKQVEDWVNEQIQRDLPVKREIMTPQEARKLGAIGLFDEKYQEQVSIYTIMDSQAGEIVSREFCGGPHVERTGQIGKFKIIKEEAVAAGIRRIKATVE
jgi:alanyl-tRNA synthetase